MITSVHAGGAKALPTLSQRVRLRTKRARPQPSITPIAASSRGDPPGSIHKGGLSPEGKRRVREELRIVCDDLKTVNEPIEDRSKTENQPL